MYKYVLSTLIAATAVAGPVQAAPYNEMPAGQYELDLAHASIVWKVSHLGLSDYVGRFTDFDATLDYNPADPAQSQVTVTINPLSVSTEYPGDKDFNGELATGDGWFNGDEFPQITFTSTSIERTGEDTGVMTGDLTFLGVTKPLMLDVVFNGAMNPQPFNQMPTLGFSATGELQRSAWGMDTYVPSIGDTVELQIEAEFNLPAAE